MRRSPGWVDFRQFTPSSPIETVQGALMLMYDLQEFLKEISGFSAIALQPAAGAQGELTGVLIIKAYHNRKGQNQRIKF